MFASCQKTPAFKPVFNNSFSNPELLLSGLVVLDPGGIDTSYKVFYSYDANNRLVSMSDPFIIGTYIYNSNGDVTGIFGNQILSGTNINSQYVYVYNNKTITLSYPESDTADINEYTVTNNKVTKLVYGDNVTDNMVYSGNNIISLNEIRGATDTILTKTFTYGDKKGAYYDSGFKVFLDYNLLQYIGLQNNLLSETTKVYGFDKYTTVETYTYTYNNLNYPVSALHYEDGMLLEELIYTYIHANKTHKQ
jgi:hypothetical protein